MMIKIRLLVALALAWLATTAEVTAADKLLHRAFAELTEPQTQRDVRCYADVLSDSTTGATQLRIYAEKGSGRETYEHPLEAGQEFVQSVGSIYLKGIGRALLVDWQWGAMNLGVTIYALGADGRITEILRDGGLYGHYLTNLPDDARSLNIVVIDRDDRDSTKIARIYAIGRDGKFGKPRIVRAKEDFWFELKGK